MVVQRLPGISIPDRKRITDTQMQVFREKTELVYVYAGRWKQASARRQVPYCASQHLGSGFPIFSAGTPTSHRLKHRPRGFDFLGHGDAVVEGEELDRSPDSNQAASAKKRPTDSGMS